ncbi:helix-turn-helix domain-containing protein [Aeromicrobium piscarium]|nr:helix-turn-helix domain-containing protein [Aeromicrobium piscarium]
MVAEDRQVHFLVSKAITSFIDHRGDPQAAAAEMSDLLWEAGHRYAQARRHHQEITGVFERAWQALRQQLNISTSTDLGALLTQLFEALRTYFLCLQRQALNGWKTHATSTNNRTMTHARVRISTAPREPERVRLDDVTYVARLADAQGINDQQLFRAVVATSDDVGVLRTLSEVLVGSSSSEALVPARWSNEDIERLTGDQVVVGAAVPLQQMLEPLRLARRAAKLLDDGVAVDPRTVVPCEDLSMVLIAHGNQHLADILVGKHLDELAQEPPGRRLRYAEFALAWIGCGGSIAQVADELEIPKQTAHSRVKRLREMFGDKLNRPSDRLEITVALYAVLPTWRAAPRRRSKVGH